MIGTIVKFTDKRGVEKAAIITDDHGEIANLQVFYKERNGTRFFKNVHYSPNKEPKTWRY